VIVLDSSGLLALLNATDPDHDRCADALSAHRAPFVIPAGILGEVGYLIESRLGDEALREFVDALAAGQFSLDCGDRDFPAIAQALERYPDLRLGLADASVLACAQRRAAPVLTLDFRDFAPLAREGRIDLALPA
jgi:uncharacterized protein